MQQLYVYEFNRIGQLCKLSKQSYVLDSIVYCDIYDEIKQTKDGKYTVIPLVKKHIFGMEGY